MADDDVTRLTIRLQSQTVEQLHDELSHFNTEAARFQFLAQFYLDYKELGGQPVKLVCDDCCEDSWATDSADSDLSDQSEG